MGTDYYDLLGVSKNANTDEIKKQYKKMAMKYHPDRNKDNKEESETKFKDISNAYNVLTDPKKKQIYDQCGEEGLKQGGGMGGVDPFSMFQEMFSEGGMPGGFSFGGMGGMGGMGGRGQNKSTPEVKRINVSLEDLYKGKTMKFNITHTVLKEDKKKSIKICSKCEGNGVEVRIQRLGPIIQQMHVPCGSCNGCGKICDKSYLEKVNKKVTLPIKKGMCSGEQIILNGLGNFNIQTMENDNLIFIINETEHAVFRREKNDLLIGLDITLLDSLIGFKFEFSHLDGEKCIIESDEIIKQDDIKVIKNKGMPYNSRNEVFGDLIFKFNIVYPTKIDKKDMDKLKEILPDSMFDNFNSDSKQIYKLENYKNVHNSNSGEEQQQNGPSCQQQ